jgi:hypothetical protein
VNYEASYLMSSVGAGGTILLVFFVGLLVNGVFLPITVLDGRFWDSKGLTISPGPMSTFGNATFTTTKPFLAGDTVSIGFGFPVVQPGAIILTAGMAFRQLTLIRVT